MFLEGSRGNDLENVKELLQRQRFTHFPEPVGVNSNVTQQQQIYKERSMNDELGRTDQGNSSILQWIITMLGDRRAIAEVLLEL